MATSPDYYDTYRSPHVILRRQVVRIPEIGEWSDDVAINMLLDTGINQEHVRVDFEPLPIDHDRIMTSTFQVIPRTADGHYDVISTVLLYTDEQMAQIDLLKAEREIEAIERAGRLQSLVDELYDEDTE